MKNEFTNGRKGCSGCYSESNELLQFNGTMPNGSKSFHVHPEVPGTRDDIKAVLSMASINMDKKLAKERQMEAVFA